MPITLVSIFSLLGLVHIYWALGGTFAKSVSVHEENGRPAFTPSALATVVVAFCFFGSALLVAALVDWLVVPVSKILLIVPGFGLVAVFLIRSIGDFKHIGFFKRVHDTRFAKYDTFLYSPLCLFISAATLLVVLGYRA